MDAGGAVVKIFVAGATGVLGRRAVNLLVDAGHDVTGVARSDAKAEVLRGLGASPARIDVFDAFAVHHAVAESDVVMNLATHIPPPMKSGLRGAWKQNDRLRAEASRNLVDAAISVGAKRYMQESIALFYVDRGAAEIDEDVPLDLPTNAATVAEAEAQAMRFAPHGAAVVLRFGMFYAPDATHTKTQLRTAKLGFSPFFGSEDGYQAMIHLDDAASAVLAALQAPTGEWNVVDDEPITRKEAAEALAVALGRRRLRALPKALTKVGGDVFTALTRSQRVSNRRFKDATGWAPSYPSVREGFGTVAGPVGAPSM